MSDTFRDMNKINESSAALIKELEKFIDWANCEISYHDFLEIAELRREYTDDDGEVKNCKALDYAIDNLEPSPLHNEINQARQLIETLKKFTIIA